VNQQISVDSSEKQIGKSAHEHRTVHFIRQSINARKQASIRTDLQTDGSAQKPGSKRIRTEASNQAFAQAKHSPIHARKQASIRKERVPPLQPLLGRICRHATALQRPRRFQLVSAPTPARPRQSSAAGLPRHLHLPPSVAPPPLVSARLPGAPPPRTPKSKGKDRVRVRLAVVHTCVRLRPEGTGCISGP
jgi:hypothetical protein